MNRIIFTIILIFTAVFSLNAQSNVNQSTALKIDEYWEDKGSERVKIDIDNLSEELQKNSNAEGIIKIQARGNKTVLMRLSQLRRLMIFRQVDLTRISFAIDYNNKKIMEYWTVPKGENIPECNDCMIIRAEDYDKLANFFNPKMKQKIRRNK